jgi:multiple antibiotic resistance protein
MSDLVVFAISVFTGFFAVMNPITNLPIFMGLVEQDDKSAKIKIARKSTVTAFFIVASFVVFGKVIFELFDLTIPAFKITGGILIFYIGFEMLMSQKSKIQNQDISEDNDSVAISPLAIPILAGPGTIVTAMSFVTDASIAHIAIVVSVLAVMLILTYMAFLSSTAIVKLIGTDFINVVGKLMGLILAIMGTGMVMNGIKLAFNL